MWCRPVIFEQFPILKMASKVVDALNYGIDIISMFSAEEMTIHPVIVYMICVLKCYFLE